MKFIITSIILIIFASCNAKKAIISPQKEVEFKTFLVEKIKIIDAAAKVDTFRFVKFDTLTLKHKYVAMMQYVSDDMAKINEELKDHVDKWKFASQEVSLLYDLRSYGSNSLYEKYKQDMQDEKKAIDDFAVKMSQLKNSSDSLSELAKTADSTHTLNYYAVCFYQIRAKDQTVTRDTAYILLNLDKNIIDREAYYKLK